MGRLGQGSRRHSGLIQGFPCLVEYGMQALRRKPSLAFGTSLSVHEFRPGMKLHWSPRSPFVRKVMIFAHETGLIHQLHCVRTVVAMTAANPVLLDDNPLGKIPTLMLDDGSALYDSGVICEYLDSLHQGARLFPPEGV